MAKELRYGELTRSDLCGSGQCLDQQTSATRQHHCAGSGDDTGRDGNRPGQAKMPKQTAQYQDSPNGDQKCEGCRFFIEGGSCRLVEGEISPNGWCRLYRAKA